MAVGGTLAFGGESMWPVYALAAVTIAYVVFRPMLRKKKDPLEKLPSLGLAQQRAVEREMSSLLVELSEMARQVTAQLDTRAAKLDLLIQEADRKIAQLQSLSEGGALRERAESGREVRESPDERHLEVYSLADGGQTAAEIARQLGRPRGEIELILALRPRQAG